MTDSSPIKNRMLQKLNDRFSPQKLEVLDESDLHRGHAGHDGAGESHFKIVIVSDSFEGKSRIARHRMLYETLDAELKERVHALSINAFSIKEADL